MAASEVDPIHLFWAAVEVDGYDTCVRGFRYRPNGRFTFCTSLRNAQNVQIFRSDRHQQWATFKILGQLGCSSFGL